ncbi:MAG: PEP-CTERM sorting domain-containing protein [Armatimonadetes bacterium]|nr:MAG: PEP-CTERM sorting domain-containing protein [Armatimonadota bacterium]
MKKTIVFVAMLISCSAFGAWIPVDAGGRVPMEPGATRSRDWTVFSFTVSRLPNRITDVNLRLDLVHSWVEDLQIILEAPDRSVVTLFDRLPGGPPRFDDFDDTVFDDEAPKAIQSASAPYAGAFRPKEALSRFDGRNPNGTWRLKIWDHYTGDYGWLYRQGDPRFETRRGPLSGTAIEISAVPEPLTWLALGGLAGMALRRRKTMR